MRALEPVRVGDVERDGVRVHWEEFGEGEPTIALLPTWSIAPSRHWKFQVPYLARHHRVITFDGRGCGLSDRPVESSAYSYLEFAADALAVLDVTETDRAVLAGLSLGAVWSLVLAADEPERVLGVVCLGPSLALAPMPPDRANHPFNERLATTDGWAKYNRYHWLEGGYLDFLEFFFDLFFPEPHSTKQIEDFVGWGLEIDPSTLVTIEDGLFARRRESARALCERITVPVLVVHGDEDAMTPHASGEALADITGGQLVTIGGGGHGVQARDPVIVNHVIKRFVDRVGVRARYPDDEGFVERDGIKVGYELYGEGGAAAFLVPASPITHARSWKGLIPFLSRHVTVVSTDGRGTGRSDRPHQLERYVPGEIGADMLAVLHATDVGEVVVVAHCHATPWALRLAAEHPELVVGVVIIAPGIAVAPPHPYTTEAETCWQDVLDRPTGWALRNRHAWRHADGYREWVEFFFDQQLPEPHSTKHYEDTVSWALETEPEAMIAEREGRHAPTGSDAEELCRRIECPCLVIHGSDDRCQPLERGRRVAELTGGELVVLDGAGHLPHARDPVKVNQLIIDFIEQTTGVAMPTRVWTRGLSRRKRALYLSSPIGLGHARRDVTVAKELKRLRPDIEIDWLAQHPVTAVLEAEGEHIHPASRWLANESAHIASESSGHDLHCFQALRRMDEILVANFMLFQEVVDEGLYDVIIGDEAWDVDHFWHENPELKRGQHVWLTDFVGFLPMPDGGEHEAYLTTDYNAEMIEHVARYPWIRDRAIFVGNPDDIVADRFGAELPAIRDWTEEHFSFSGYITGFTPPTAAEIPAWRDELGYHDDELVCIVAVGGSGVGRALLDKVIAAYPIAKRQLPALRMIAVAGPRIDPAMFPTHPGLEVHGYVDRLYRHLCVCDLAVVQGGLTTTMELAAAKRPFLYFPLGHHFEQNFHVRHRLDRYGAGRCMDYASTDPDLLATAITNNIGRPTTLRDVETDGAARAAQLIAELV